MSELLSSPTWSAVGDDSVETCIALEGTCEKEAAVQSCGRSRQGAKPKESRVLVIDGQCHGSVVFALQVRAALMGSNKMGIGIGIVPPRCRV